jgi:UDP-N-acetylglucosamine 2-epimerase (non-hydrolysing)
MKKVLFVLGTRPEAIKLAPLINYFKLKASFDIKVCNTAQHREMLDEVFNFFSIDPDYDLNIMTHAQSLPEVLSKSLTGIGKVLEEYQPDIVFVQGDTTTAFSGALAAFYKKIKVAHVEAGLRSGDKFSPFPEEINRVFISKITDYHFAPTKTAYDQLQKEGINKNVWNVGNTVIDALLQGCDIIKTKEVNFKNHFSFLDKDKRTILLTCHRRENFGRPLKEICAIVKKIIDTYKDVQVVYPVHPNPNVKQVVYEELSSLERVHLIEPLSYPYLIYLMQTAYLIITDSGGIQEEAPSLGKPVVVIRETTERMEGVQAGTAILGGNNYASIWKAVTGIMDDPNVYNAMSGAVNPYGDGKTAERIYSIIEGLTSTGDL